MPLPPAAPPGPAAPTAAAAVAPPRSVYQCGTFGCTLPNNHTGLHRVSIGGAALRARKRRAPPGAAEGGARHEVAVCAPDYPGEWHGAWEECTVMAED